MTQPIPKHREAFDPNTLGKQFESSFKNIKIPEKATSDEILALVKKAFEKHNPDKYETDLRKSLGKYASDKKIESAVKYYKKFFDTASGKFYRLAEKRRQDFEDARETILQAARKNLDSLKTGIKSDIKVKEVTPKLGDFEYQHQTEKKFRAFVEAMSKKYLKNNQHNEKLTAKGKKIYEGFRDRFQTGMKAYTEAQLQYIFENSHDKTTLVKNLQGLRTSIRNAYTLNDKNEDGSLSLKELSKLKGGADLEVITKLISSSESENKILKKLEHLNFFNRKSLKQAAKLITEQFIANVTRNGSEAKFTKAVQTLTKSKKKMNFDDAASTYRDHMAKLAGTGIKEVLNAARKMNEAVNKGNMDTLKLEHVTPSSIHILVLRQRDLILRREIEPKQIDDRQVAEFMSTNLVGRMKFLNDKVQRQALFQSIKNIKLHYPKIYRDKYKDSIPTKVSDLSTRSTRPDLPTTHDRIARMLAIITLAKEAEWTIKNLSQSEGLKSQNIAKEIDETNADANLPRLNFRYRWRNTLYRTGYMSRAVRGGMNTGSVFRRGLQVWAGATLFLNFMNARKHSSGKWLEGLKNVIPNPYFIGGLATMFGLKKLQQNPEYKRYLFQPEGGQETISTHAALGSLGNKKQSKGEKVGRHRVISYINNPGEFNAMKALMKNKSSGDKIRNALEKTRGKARKNKQKYPVLTRDDLKNTFGVPEDKLPQAGNDRIRFLFYQKFLTTSRSVRQLKANCETWK